MRQIAADDAGPVMLWVVIVGVLTGLGFLLFESVSDMSERERKSEPAQAPSAGHPVAPDTPVAFGYKCIWLALRTTDTQRVSEVLQLVGARPSSWAEGIDAAYQGSVFVTPPIGDWTLAASTSLPTPPDSGSRDLCTAMLERLAPQFPEVHYFATHRVVEGHAWAKIVSGSFVRKYAYIGDMDLTPWDEGALTTAETRLGLEFGSRDKYPDEDSVMRIAGAWSVDPSTLEELGLPAGTGILGSLPR